MKSRIVSLHIAAGLASCWMASSAPAQALPREQLKQMPQLVATFSGPMPTGVTVSHRGRIFVNYPRWGDPVKYTVAELRKGRAVPFPNMAWNRRDKPQSERLVSVQSVVVDPADRLWILDTGSVKFGPTRYGGPKLVGVDLKTNRVFRKILFPPSVALKYTYLNDVRFDLRRGQAGMAFITDSSGAGPNGIIVVDLATGRSWRKLHNHPSTKAEPKFVPIVEGMALMQRLPRQKPKYVAIGSDGIAISADGERLYYCPLASRKLYSVSVDALANERMTDAQVAATVTNHGDKGASDGLESDDRNRIYCTEYEHNAILRRYPNGLYETLVHDPRVLWPDTMSIARDGYLYFTANQLHRQPNFHNGQDLRRKPYSLFRIKINAGPVLLRRTP
ncbi:MAG TPA: L-dopachrome tautomerase-related protein [Abditibacteriaceae bacterium]|nr:L-dopachrome tautomerase-related protein [Abditibacteriaceae bacterium]